MLALPVLAGMTACSESEADYTAAEVLAGEQVFFPSEMPTTCELSTEASSTTVPLYRVKKDNALTVNLVSTSTSENIKVAPSAQFAEGETVANVTISYNPEQVVAGKYDTITISISDDSYTTPYGATAVTLLVGQAEPWVSIGNGYFSDGYFATGYFRVKIEQNQLNPDIYRVVAPYATMWNYFGEADYLAKADPYFTFRILEKGTVLGKNSDGVEVATPVDGCVYYADVNTGYVNSNYDDFVSVLHPARLVSRTSEETLANNAVVAWQEDGKPGLVDLAPMYYLKNYGGGWDYTKNSGIIEIIMPGYELKDYSVAVSYQGRYYDADDNLYAVASVDELGEDVAEVRLVVTAGKDSYNDGISAILGAEEGDASIVSSKGLGSVNVPMPADAETGKYTVTAVTFDADGEAQEVGYFTFSYTASGAVEDTWTLVGNGDYTYTLFFGSEEEPEVDAGLALYRNDQNPARFKIEHWGYDVDFFFTMDAEGNVLVDDQETGYVHPSYGMVCVDDAVDYRQDSGWGVSSYDSETGTFNFAVVYYVSAGVFGYGTETFKLTAGEAKHRKVAAKKNMKPSKRATLKANADKRSFKVRGAKAYANNAKKPFVKEAPSYDFFSKYAK